MTNKVFTAQQELILKVAAGRLYIGTVGLETGMACLEDAFRQYPDEVVAFIAEAIEQLSARTRTLRAAQDHGETGYWPRLRVAVCDYGTPEEPISTPMSNMLLYTLAPEDDMHGIHAGWA